MTLLQEAEELINGQRKEDYGDAKACFKRIAAFWSDYLCHRDHSELSCHDVANMMILLKVARDANNPGQRQNHTDIAGYSGLTERIN